MQIEEFRLAIEHLQSAGFSMYQISHEIGRQPDYVKKAIAARTKPTGSVIAGLAKQFYVSPSKLLFGTGRLILDAGALDKKDRWAAGRPPKHSQ